VKQNSKIPYNGPAVSLALDFEEEVRQNLTRVRVLQDSNASNVLGCVFEKDAKDSCIVVGDSKKVLSQMPSGAFQTCVTSPPYWSLRDYNIKGQIGLEFSFPDYIKSLVEVFEEVRRVLRDDGTFWLTIGDSYTSGGRTWRAPDKKNPGRAMDIRPPTPEGLKSKDLIGVPWKLAFALQEAGWYLRADCIWNKPNCQPESVKDRPTRCHEYVFLFTKSEKYLYDNKAVRGPNHRNLRTVWDINTQPYNEAHFATYPPALVEPCITLGSRPGDLILDPFLGSGTTGLVALQMSRRFVGIELNPSYVAVAEKRLGDFCATMAGPLADLVRQISPTITPRDINELPLLTLGSQFQGGNNNTIGKQATIDVFQAIIAAADPYVAEQRAKGLTVKNASGQVFEIQLASDPDVAIQEIAESGKVPVVAIEIKGGTDQSNAHNRAGEAEKSHQKIKDAGYGVCWTIIPKKGLDMAVLQRESPTTDRWFDVAQILAREGDDWTEFRKALDVALDIKRNPG
jgi:site-specific DNA-methyltransferase (cytosine-N4-specific)